MCGVFYVLFLIYKQRLSTNFSNSRPDKNCLNLVSVALQKPPYHQLSK